MRLTLLNPRYRSLTRGNILVLASLFTAFRLSHFPANRASLWQFLPLFFAAAGTADTLRCMRKRWSFYHGGVLLCIYMDLMAICMILIFLIYPYMQSLFKSH